MTNTQEAFDRWCKDVGQNVYMKLAPKDLCSEAWQACQAHNDAVIAELVEALEIMTPIYNQLAWIAVCWNDHNFDGDDVFNKVNTAFNDAGFKRGDGVEPVNNFVEKLDNLIAKHKKGTS